MLWWLNSKHVYILKPQRIMMNNVLSIIEADPETFSGNHRSACDNYLGVQMANLLKIYI